MINVKALTLDNEYLEVFLIGAGATGSRMAVLLMELNDALLQLGRKGIHLTIVDDDIVEKHNISKQKYLEQDLGQYKAPVLAERLSYTFNTSVDCIVQRIKRHTIQDILYPKNHALGTIVISTIDNIEGRRLLNNYILSKENSIFIPTIWFDIGNSEYTGQIFIRSTSHEKLNNEIDFSTFSDEPDEPSCSMLESLSKQSFMINQIMVDYAMAILSRLVIKGELNTSELYVNLNKYRITSNEI